MKFFKNYKWFFIASLSIMLVGLVIFLTMGFNLGIDFNGGVSIQVRFEEQVVNADIANALAPFNLSPDVISVGTEGKEVIIKTTASITSEQRIQIFDILKNDFKAVDSTNSMVTEISPKIGKEAMTRALNAVIFAAIGMLIYITVRFEWKFGVAAIIALIHDVLILLSVYAIFRIPLNMPFIAAVLTVVGYSINDTIVVFDRIRDTSKYAKTSNYMKIAEDSISQTITRSINTSFTTLLVIGSLYVLGVQSIKELAFPLLAGVIAGTYSSIFIASPAWVMLKNKFSKKRA